MTANEQYFCTCYGEGVIPFPTGHVPSGLKGAFLSACKWNEIPTICFVGGTSELQERVIAVAREWKQFANIELYFLDKGPADIRIAFDPGAGSWSYLGTTCRTVVDPLPTMNFGWLTDDSPDSVLRPVVLHEFGHALGLVHEHQSPAGGGIQWNVAAVTAQLSAPPYNWDAHTINENVFKKYEPAVLLATSIDPQSIMMYPLPAAWTTDGRSTGFNTELSETDKFLISQAYPQ